MNRTISALAVAAFAAMTCALVHYQSDRLYQLRSTRVESGFSGIADYNLTAEDCAERIAFWKNHTPKTVERIVVTCEVQP